MTSDKIISIRSTHIHEADGVLHELLHKKSGAKIFFLEREDDNKTFAIGFKTIPTDDTGVFHILEHSVLCGSEKFPLKDPFSELIKGSVSTYINALTYSDKTVYPVASKNDKAFHGLVDVYLDAVFHPNAIKSPYVFMQEGYHYEIDEDDRLGINGVVYNEMKGAYSSVDDYADYHLTRLLSPGSTCSYDSGGNPDFIPKLTFDAFCKAHKRFYHPSNCCIFLDGSIKTDEIFELICSYLDKYDVSEPVGTSDLGAPTVTEPLTLTYPSDLVEDKTRIYLSHNTFLHSERKKNVALDLATLAIADSNNAPLTKRILDSGLCKSFSFSATRSYDLNALNISFTDVKDGKENELINLYQEILGEVLREGIPKENLLALLDRLEFSLREADYGTYPKGMVNMSGCMEWFFHGENPADSLVYEEIMEFLRRMVDTDYYDSILKEALANPRATLILHPDPDFTKKKDAELRKELDLKYEKMCAREKAEIIKLNEALTLWQETPDTEDALSSIPRLTVGDLTVEPKKTPIETETFQGVEIISHVMQTRGISYPELLFDVSDIPIEDIPYLRLFAGLMSEWDTEMGDVTYFKNRVRRHLGMLYMKPMPIKHKDEPKLYISVRLSCLDKERASAEALLTEYLYSTLFTNKSVLIQSVKQMYNASVENATTKGESLAMIRDAAKHSAFEALSEELYGYKYHLFIKRLAENIETAADEVLAKLEQIRNKYLRRERLTVGITDTAGSDYAKKLILRVKDGGTKAARCEITPLPKLNEGIAVPAGTGYSARTANLNEIGKNLHTGAFATASNIMSYELLWNEIRVKGGAYDTAFIARANSGTLGCYSYCDPSASRSVEVFGNIHELLSDFIDSSPDLLKYVIGTVGALDTVSTPRGDGWTSTKLYLSAKSHEDIVRSARESIAVTLEDLQRIAEILKRAMEVSTFTIVASREELEKNKKIDVILEL